jgi:hypothetical protein
VERAAGPLRRTRSGTRYRAHGKHSAVAHSRLCFSCCATVEEGMSRASSRPVINVKDAVKGIVNKYPRSSPAAVVGGPRVAVVLEKNRADTAE